MGLTVAVVGMATEWGIVFVEVVATVVTRLEMGVMLPCVAVVTEDVKGPVEKA